jgi:hypothetical protein
MVARPYFKKTTRELASIFEKCGHDAAILNLLLEELVRRHRPLALELREKVKRLLACDSMPVQEPAGSEQPSPPVSSTETGALPRLVKAPTQATPIAYDIIGRGAGYGHGFAEGPGIDAPDLRNQLTVW